VNSTTRRGLVSLLTAAIAAVTLRKARAQAPALPPAKPAEDLFHIARLGMYARNRETGALRQLHRREYVRGPEPEPIAIERVGPMKVLYWAEEPISCRHCARCRSAESTAPGP
jgi:hypothetical protein